MRMAVIPARGGSKRIPRKNIRDFCGKPIIAYSIDAAIQSRLFERVIVSTDDDEIAEVARDFGAEIPFMRPAELSNDFTGTIPVIRHAIKAMQAQNVWAQHVCCIYATAPFISAHNIERGWRILLKTGADYAFSVTSFASPIQRAIRITPGGHVAMFQPESYEIRSQDLEKAYHDAGQFYWGRAAAFLDTIPMFSDHAVPVLLPRYQVQDIDTLEDWDIAELMFSVWQNKLELNFLESQTLSMKG
jgi:pseudaminic acid cytidylyltransferase